MRNADFRFFFPSAGTLFVTSSPKSSRINYGISQHFRSPRFATNRDIFNYTQLVSRRSASPYHKQNYSADLPDCAIIRYGISRNFLSFSANVVTRLAFSFVFLVTHLFHIVILKALTNFLITTWIKSNS